MDRRTTSAGYRLPVGPTSNAHLGAISKTPAKSGAGGHRKETVEHNEVAENKIWRERVRDEWKGVKVWDKNWGFMKDYDPKGRPKTPRKLPEREPVFSSNLPNTKGHEYGSRVNTEMGEKMAEMEFLFCSSSRRRKIGTEFVCY